MKALKYLIKKSSVCTRTYLECVSDLWHEQSDCALSHKLKGAMWGRISLSRAPWHLCIQQRASAVAQPAQPAQSQEELTHSGSIPEPQSQAASAQA